MIHSFITCVTFFLSALLLQPYHPHFFLYLQRQFLFCNVCVHPSFFFHHTRELCDKQLSEFAASPRSLSAPAASLGHLTQALTESMGGDTMIPSVLIGLLGSASLILQNCGQRLDCKMDWRFN